VSRGKIKLSFRGRKKPEAPAFGRRGDRRRGAVGWVTASQTQSATQSEIYDCVDPERVAYLILWKRLKSVAGDEFARLNTGVLLTRENRAGREPKW